MKPQKISERYKKIISSYCHWKLITSSRQSGVECLNDPQHIKWFSRHTDSHPHREVLFALEGDCHITLNGCVYPCTPGTAIFFDEYEKHDQKYPHTSSRLRHIWFSIIEDAVTVNFLKIENGRIKNFRNSVYLLQHNELCHILLNSWQSLKSEAGLLGSVSLEKLRAAFFLVFLAAFAKENSVKAGNKKNEYREQIIVKIKNHIYQTSGKYVSLTELAKIAGYSKYHFLRMFEKFTGTSVHTYINKVRVEKFKEMQQDGYLKKEIANALGFSSSSALAHWTKSVRL